MADRRVKPVLCHFNSAEREDMSNRCDIGLIGLAVMGENLALNIESRGFSVAVFNRTVGKVDEFISGRAAGKKFCGCHSLKELIGCLATPRKVMLMIKAGPAVDEFIERLIPLLSPGDVLIDGGNTHFADTERRTRHVESKGLLYIGTGVSGGEEGALKGPSMMPGGSPAAWPLVKPIFQAISAKVGPNGDIPCCDWVGPRGAGHYVKMVHNGIEYGDMQLICEAYWMLKLALDLNNDDLYGVFSRWYEGELNSYLIEITRDIFTVKDAETGKRLVDLILDAAGEGTGKWMSQLAGPGRPQHAGDRSGLRPVAFGDEGGTGASGQDPLRSLGPLQGSAAIIRRAHPAGPVCLQDLQLRAGLRATSRRSHRAPVAAGPGLDRALWRGGCIIRAVFLERIKEAFAADAGLENLLLAPYFTEVVAKAQLAWRNVVATAAHLGIPVPGFLTALAYYDGYRSERLPANLLQAQRDYFGAHTYQRIEQAGRFPYRLDP